ncbi:MAG: M28 family peptidase [bacterium]
MAAARFEALGLAATREPFRASVDAIRRFKLMLHLGGAACAALTCAAASATPALGALIGTATLAAASLAGRWSIRAERAFDSGRIIESENVVARRAVDATAAAPVPDALAPRVVFLAHVDSKSMRWPTSVAASLLIGAVAGLALVAGWCALAALHAVPPPGAAAAATAGVVIASAFALGLFNSSGNESPGAMDNASGVAVLLELAGTLPHDAAFDGADLTFVATGAEEIGLAGAMRWIQRHAPECPRGATLFINFDSVGVGEAIVVMNARGAAPVRGDARVRVGIAQLARCVATEVGIALRVVPGLLGVGVDTMPVAARGFATITILGEVLGPASRRFHSRRDTVDHLDEAGLRRAADFGRAIALAWIDAQRNARGDAARPAAQARRLP